MKASKLVPLAIVCSGALLSSACTVGSIRGTGEYGPSAYTSDSGIRQRVVSVLHAQPGFDEQQVKVETFHGIVQLTGHVDTHAHLVTMLAAVDHVDGVKTVHTYVTERHPNVQVDTVTRVAAVAAPTAAAPLQLAANGSGGADIAHGGAQ